MSNSQSEEFLVTSEYFGGMGMKGILGAVLVLCLAWTANASEAWQTNRHLWEERLPDRANVALIAGGDINGDLRDDIVVTYRERSAHDMLALVSVGEEYAVAEFDALRGDFLRDSDFGAFERIEVRDGLITVYTEFDVARIDRRLSGVTPTMVELRYVGDKLRPVGVVSTGEVRFGDNERATAHLFYDVERGEVFFRYLSTEERVGEARYYLQWRYSRTVANKVNGLNLNGDKNKWYLISKPQLLQNGPIGSPITHGFERWHDHRDLSAEYFLAHDEKHVYILVDVRDDVFRQNFSGDQSLRGDHVELWFGENTGARYQIALNPGDFDSIEPEAMLWYFRDGTESERPLKKVDVVSRRTEEGYRIEARIPVSVFGRYSTRVLPLFTLSVSDSDEEDRQEKLLSSSSLIWSQSWTLGRIIWR